MPQPQRAKRFSDYLTKCEGTFDSTCFLNIRDEKEVRIKDRRKLADGIYTGTMEINKSLFIVDGQHRIKGLELALKVGLKKDFLVPVLITIGKKQPDEALSFLIINRTAKGIRADLTDELILKTIREKDLTDNLKTVLGLTIQRNIGEFALNAAKRINEDGDSFWCDKMILPNQQRTKEKTVNQRVFTQSLIDAIKSSSSLKRTANIGDLEQFVIWSKDYWNAIARTCPLACSEKDWRKYSLLKRAGVTAMNQIFGRIIDDAGQDRSEKGLLRSLAKITSLSDDNWHAKEGRFGKLGTSFTALKNIYATLEMELDSASLFLK